MIEVYKILHVEDSPTQQILMQDLLESQGWQVESTSNAQEALQRLEEGTPNLILIDYILPGMRGDELCRKIRLTPKTALVPVVLLTAGETSRPSEDVGANLCLSKSTPTEELLGRVRALLSHSASNR
jgi:CheY-like chemotaxis protein